MFVGEWTTSLLHFDFPLQRLQIAEGRLGWFVHSYFFLLLQITRNCKTSLVSFFVIHIHTSYMSLLLRHLRPVKVLIFATRVGVPWVSIGVFSVVVGVPDSLVGVLKIGIFC